MKKELREYLLTIGLRSAATDKEAFAFYRNLEGDQYDHARAIREGRQPAGDRSNGDDSDSGEGEDSSDGEGQRSQGQQVPPATRPQTRSEPTAAEAIAQERERAASIRSTFGDEAQDHGDLMQRCIDEGYTVERSAGELLDAIRASRASSIGGGGAPAIHSRGGVTTEALQAAAMMRSDIALDNPAFSGMMARHANLPAWLRADVNSEERQRAMDAAYEHRDLSMVDFCRMSLAAAGRQVPSSRSDAIRNALEFGTLEPIFTTNINARLLPSYVEAEDTTSPWTNTIDVDDYKSNDMTTMGKMGGLTRHGRGKTADMMDRGAETEPLRVFKYSGQFKIDEIDIINNRLGDPTSDSPEEMGRSAAQLVPDLVYSVLLENANLVKDGIPLFDQANGKNDFLGAGSVLSIQALEDAITAMADQRQRGRPLNLRARYLLVPPQLQFAAERILSSAVLANLVNPGTNLVGQSNPVSTKGIVVISDSRLGNSGVTNPENEVSIDGNNAQWFLTAAPGANGAKTVTKAFLRGTGRMPQTRSYTLDKGEWGIGWDIKHTAGAKALDRLAMQRHGSDQ